ncbi:MAG: M16 family metallopeptidase [Aaplasma endosymbiont of Hyalomma asiaticum]
MLFFGAHCFAAANIDIDIQDVVTKGGIKYWYTSGKTLPIVSVSIAFQHTGSLYDPVGKKGLAALAAAVMERGVTKDGVKLSEQLGKRGIELDVSADGDNTYVSLRTLAENLDMALYAVGDSLSDATIDHGVFEIEKERLKHDSDISGNAPQEQASDMMDKVIFGDQPHAYPIKGTPDTIENISLEDIENYRQENFDLDNMFIGIAGDVSQEHLSEVLDKAFSKISRGQNSKRAIEGVPNIGSRGYVKYDSPQSVVMFTTKSISRGDPKYHMARILNRALGGIGLSSILMKELREKLGITYSVSSFLQHFGGVSLFSCVLFTDNNTVKEGVDAFLRTIEQVRENGLDERTFQIAKANIESSFLFSFIKTADVAERLVKFQLRGLGKDHIQKYNSKNESVSLQEVNEFAKDFLGDFSIVEVGMKNNIGATITSWN